MNDETWKPIPGWPEYEASSFGRVKRIVRSQTSRPGFLKQGDSKGYKNISLCRDGKPSKKWVHRIVALTFLGDPPTPKHEAAHGDGNPSNNHLYNLRWATGSENQRDRKKHGTGNQGEAHGLSKITLAQARWAKSVSGLRLDEIAKTIGTCFSNVDLIRRGLSWKDQLADTPTGKSYRQVRRERKLLTT